MSLMKKFAAAFQRLQKRFDFAAHKKRAAQEERVRKAKRPPKRRRRR